MTLGALALSDFSILSVFLQHMLTFNRQERGGRGPHMYCHHPPPTTKQAPTGTYPMTERKHIHPPLTLRKKNMFYIHPSLRELKTHPCVMISTKTMRAIQTARITVACRPFVWKKGKTLMPGVLNAISIQPVFFFFFTSFSTRLLPSSRPYSSRTV